MDRYIFCGNPSFNGKATVVLTIRGCNGIETANEERGGNINILSSQVVHVNCRRKYVNPNAIKRD
jgi:hypothetical protein